jgi:hypothetical protein
MEAYLRSVGQDRGNQISRLDSVRLHESAIPARLLVRFSPCVATFSRPDTLIIRWHAVYSIFEAIPKTHAILFDHIQDVSFGCLLTNQSLHIFADLVLSI